MACKHPMKDREWKDGNLTCNACGTVLRQSNPEPKATDDLFAAGPAEEHPPQACTSVEICAHAGDDCTEEGRIERDSACFGPADIPTTESPEEATPFDASDSIPEAAETVSASSEGLTMGNRSEAFKAPVSVQVTPIQLGEYSLEQATLYRELKELEESKKASAAAFKSRIDRVEARLDELSKIVTEGVIEVPIDCQWEFNYQMGVKRLVRLDTHQVVDEKTLTAEEYQQNLTFQADQSVAAVEECFGAEAGSIIPEGEVDNILAGQCPECMFKNGRHSPTCSKKSGAYALCNCGVCGAEETCLPYDKCPNCGEGLMEPSDVGEYPGDDMAAGEDAI